MKSEKWSRHSSSQIPMNQPIVPSDLAISRNRIHATLPLRWDHPCRGFCGGFDCLFLAPRIIPLKRKKETTKTKHGNKKHSELIQKNKENHIFRKSSDDLSFDPRFFRVEMSCLLGRLIILEDFHEIVSTWGSKKYIAGDFDIAGWMIRLGKNDTFAAVSFPRKILYILCYANGCMIVPACIHVLSMCNWQNLGPWD